VANWFSLGVESGELVGVDFKGEEVPVECAARMMMPGYDHIIAPSDWTSRQQGAQGRHPQTNENPNPGSF
jgi:hypothetical protein